MADPTPAPQPLPTGLPRSLANRVRGLLHEVLALLEGDSPIRLVDVVADGVNRLEVRVGPDVGLASPFTGPPGLWVGPEERAVLLALAGLPEGKRIKGYQLATRAGMPDDPTFKCVVRILVGRGLVDRTDDGCCLPPRVGAWLDREADQAEAEPTP